MLDLLHLLTSCGQHPAALPIVVRTLQPFLASGKPFPACEHMLPPGMFALARRAARYFLQASLRFCRRLVCACCASCGVSAGDARTLHCAQLSLVGMFLHY
jgi:hypothetical protein